MLLQVLDRIPPKPSKLNRRVSHDLDYICTKALEKHPKARYQRASELASDLQAVLRGEALDCPPATLWVSLESWWRREPILVSHVLWDRCYRLDRGGARSRCEESLPRNFPRGCFCC